MGGSADRSAEDPSPTPVRRAARPLAAPRRGLPPPSRWSAWPDAPPSRSISSKRLGSARAGRATGRPTCSTCGSAPGSPRASSASSCGADRVGGAAVQAPGTTRCRAQNRYNLPMEIFYTLAPFIIIGVLFYYTVLAQNGDAEARLPSPRSRSTVVGQKWSWTFNYKEADNPAVGSDVYEAGTINKTPDAVPPGQQVGAVHAQLARRHPLVLDPVLLPEAGRRPGPEQLLRRRAEQGGHVPPASAPSCAAPTTRPCCSTSHVVSEAEYHAYLKTLVAKGQIGEAKGPATPTSRPRPPTRRAPGSQRRLPR